METYRIYYCADIMSVSSPTLVFFIIIYYAIINIRQIFKQYEKSNITSVLRFGKKMYFCTSIFMIKGLFFILLFYLLGEAVANIIGGYIPGSVIGMMLLFVSLILKVVKAEYVKDAATVITKNMAIFFVPASVGLMVYTEVLSRSIWAIMISIMVSTILTIIVVAFVQDRMERRHKGGRL